jgi:hypothetical protein
MVWLLFIALVKGILVWGGAEKVEYNYMVERRKGCL